jgi:hypothetical protein
MVKWLTNLRSPSSIPAAAAGLWTKKHLAIAIICFIVLYMAGTVLFLSVLGGTDERSESSEREQ